LQRKVAVASHAMKREITASATMAGMHRSPQHFAMQNIAPGLATATDC
jgi:hypothetical protein